MKNIELIQSKIISPEVLAKQVARWRFKNQKIVFTNGVFDILHKGHITYLAQAADLGDVLVVGLNSDTSAKKLGKGPGRPIQDQESRALILAALQTVATVTVFDEETPAELIKLVCPDVLVKGGDWKPEQIAGYDMVKASGGEVCVIEYISGFSTTSIEQKIKNG